MDSELRGRMIALLAAKIPGPILCSLLSNDLLTMIPRVERRDGRLAPGLARPNEVAALLVDVYGTELLRKKEIRVALLEQAGEEVLMELKEQIGISARGKANSVEALGNISWHPGKSWPRRFVSVLGLPAELAGMPDGGSRTAMEIVEPPVPLQPLHDFQETLKRRIHSELIAAPPGKNRAILSLPTGAGKTRTAVEALVEHLRHSDETSGSILWIAQSEELCEQAVEAFREVWTDQCVQEAHKPDAPPVRPLSIYRFWGHYGTPDIEPGSIVVAGIQKLGALSSVQRHSFLRDFDIAVIDEAHHAIAPTYTPIFEDLTRHRNRPILGLTATPYRGNDDDFHRLIQRFYQNLLTPDFEDPISELRRRGVLSKIVTEQVSTRRTFSMGDGDRRYFEKYRDISSGMLGTIGNDYKRNQVILDRLVRIEQNRPTLVFACSIDHARLMALLLRRAGRTAAAITQGTPPSLRRLWIQQFRTGDIQFLTNVGVLTTGFDAPKIEVVAIARPTASVLLYEQMVGRGMRGKANGGTEKCLLLDFVDVIENFNDLMSYTRYEPAWRKDTRRMLRSRTLL